MGAAPFDQYADGADVAAAFVDARHAALAESGHSSYSGTLAAKHDFVVITRQVMNLDDAQHLAADLINGSDPRIDDKWGPAGAIAVRTATRTVIVDGLTGQIPERLTFDAPELERVTGLALQRGLVTATESVAGGLLRSSSRSSPYPGHTFARGHGTAFGYTGGVAELTVAKSEEAFHAQTVPDGWLFFGWASS